MLRTTDSTYSSTILQSLIDRVNENEICRIENGGNKTNLSNLSTSKKFIGAGYLTSKGTKKSGSNTKKGVETIRDSNYLTLGTKKAFNLLQHLFIQALIF